VAAAFYKGAQQCIFAISTIRAPACCTGGSGPLADALVLAAEKWGARSGLLGGGRVGPRWL
jgi:hypothetical protein